MALVDYASSDEESENECEKNDKEKADKIEVKELGSNEENVKHSSDNSNDNSDELFSSLPKPRKTFFLEDDNKLSKLLLNKNSLFSNKKESVKISVPSVSEFEDVTDQPVSKKIKPSSKGAGLFSILPPPKNTSEKKVESNLVPQVVSKNQAMRILKREEAIKKFLKKPSGKETDVAEDDDDDTTIGTSFFGSSLTQQKHDLEPEHVDHEDTSTVDIANNFEQPGNLVDNDSHLSVQSTDSSLLVKVEESNENYSIDSSQIGGAVSASDNPLDLDEKALQILCGNKKKRQQMPMNIIELSGKEVLPDSKEWLLKQFTEEKRVRSHSHKKTNGPSSQSRRKHQITYLAYQAKEQELELQNQWAANRMSRKQTQSKYGF